jgi:hypothetical protein
MRPGTDRHAAPPERAGLQPARRLRARRLAMTIRSPRCLLFQRHVDPDIVVHGCPSMMLRADPVGPRVHTITLRDSRLAGYPGAGPLRHLNFEVPVRANRTEPRTDGQLEMRRLSLAPPCARIGCLWAGIRNPLQLRPAGPGFRPSARRRFRPLAATPPLRQGQPKADPRSDAHLTAPILRAAVRDNLEVQHLLPRR